MDFGPGFYTTTDSGQAGAWAMRAAWGGGTPDIVEFRIPRNFLGEYSGQTFTKGPDFANIVRQMRTGGAMHNYDWLEGPFLRNVQAFLERGELTTEGHQLSFHTARIVQQLNQYIVR